MQKLFSPKSIAVIGASASTQKLGHIITKNIIESKYKGKLFLINPVTEVVLGLTTYKSLEFVNEVLDLSIIVIPAHLVLSVLNQIGEQKVATGNQETTYAIIISAGFKELGSAGLVLEEELVKIASQYNIRLVGPNCLGVMNLSKDKYRYNGTFDFLPTLTGNISLISQSGALISAIVEQAQSLGFGFNKIISLGNKCDINENDLISFLDQDESTAVIAIYLESFSNGENLYKLLENIRKPVIILKSGRNSVAKTAASSHTGSIAGDERVSEAFLENTSAVEVFSLDEFFDTLQLFSKFQKISTNKVVVLTNAGGLGVLALDGLTQLELELENIDHTVQDALSRGLPASAALHNPVDVLGDADENRYNFAISTLLQTQSKAAIIIILTPQVSTQVNQTATAICRFAAKYPKIAILPVFIGGDRVEAAKATFIEAKLPFFDSPEKALNSLNNLWKYTKQAYNNSEHSTQSKHNHMLPVDRDLLNTMINMNKKNKYKILNFQTVNEIARIYRLNVPKYISIDKIVDLEKVFESLGSPVVVKSINTDILHRTEKKAVITGVTSIAQITDFLDENDLKDVIFQESIDKGVEVFAGIEQDQNFGKVLVVGTGGIYAEVMDDFALAPLPETLQQVKELFEKTKISTILNNYRGISLDSDHLYKLIFGLCQVVSDFPQITSIDANPIIVTKDSCFAVDLKLSLVQV
jgi:acetate---CoA ligase (ADP-forming)